MVWGKLGNADEEKSKSRLQYNLSRLILLYWGYQIGKVECLENVLINLAVH